MNTEVKQHFHYVSNWMGDRLGADIVALEMASGVTSECLVQTSKTPLWVNRGGRGPSAFLLGVKCEDSSTGTLPTRKLVQHAPLEFS